MSNPGFYRGRRLRRTSGIRDLVRETEIRPQDLVQPYFVVEQDDPGYRNPIPSMPGQEQLGLSALKDRVGRARENGLLAVILFGLPKAKDEAGSQAYAPEGIIQEAVRLLKGHYPELTVITDVCLCEYTSHGHCGLIEEGRVQNDPTLELLAGTALAQVRAGADMVAPSDMMDGRVQAIRTALDREGYQEIPILSYAVKYSSAFYGPFRDAAQSAPSFGDRKSYQMDPANVREGLREARADSLEGADMLMVKPALPYLDVLSRLRQETDLPLAAYHVSGEYALIKAAAEKGWIDEEGVVLETLTAIKRAGADLILTYFAEAVLEGMKKK
ncbi:MAG: porphobilinogen synthase [Desulfohalobiaceae bacterium]|nr:porphobilinogen synthase [Desulfohalobiaceae bacterium]